MSKYIYTIRVEFDARDDMEAREKAGRIPLHKQPTDTMPSISARIFGAILGSRAGTVSVTAKLQQLVSGAAPRSLAKWE
jgi:hypothetical protein